MGKLLLVSVEQKYDNEQYTCSHIQPNKKNKGRENYVLYAVEIISIRERHKSEEG
jgi:hypothetical protein